MMKSAGTPHQSRRRYRRRPHALSFSLLPGFYRKHGRTMADYFIICFTAALSLSPAFALYFLLALFITSSPLTQCRQAVASSGSSRLVETSRDTTEKERQKQWVMCCYCCWLSRLKLSFNVCLVPPVTVNLSPADTFYQGIRWDASISAAATTAAGGMEGREGGQQTTTTKQLCDGTAAVR